MNNVNDEQIDKIIKEKFKQDNTISDKASSVFANFKPPVENKTTIKQETMQANQNVINALFYKRLNKFLSVAAVSLTVVLVGGTTLYFNKNKKFYVINNLLYLYMFHLTIFNKLTLS